ncbi:MAG: tetratricopeptide repeat protein [Rhizomicrobium sp.]
MSVAELKRIAGAVSLECPQLAGDLKAEIARRTAPANKPFAQSNARSVRATNRPQTLQEPNLSLDSTDEIAAKSRLSERYGLLLEGANRGDSVAALLVGIANEKGLGTPQDENQAVIWYLEAANRGLARAQVEVGRTLADGIGVPKDLPAAVSWYRKAADQSDAQGEYALGHAYELGLGVETTPSIAFADYMKAATQGLPIAEAAIGYCYIKGVGVTADPAQALIWLNKSETTPNSTAERGMGYLYSEGLGVPRDNAQAIVWYRKAADRGDPRAEYQIGLHFEQGLGVTRDLNEALSWFHKAAIQGNVDAEQSLGDLYGGSRETRDQITPNTGEAVSWWRRAAEGGSKAAIIPLTHACLDKSNADIFSEGCVTWIKQAADSGNDAALYDLGLAYELGIKPLTADIDKAIALYQRASDKGSWSAKSRLGCMYYKGLHVPKDEARGLALMQQAFNPPVETGIFGYDKCDEVISDTNYENVGSYY